MLQTTETFFPSEPHRSMLLNTLWNIQLQYGFISDSEILSIAASHDISAVEVEGVISFYHFLHRAPAGKFTIYVDDSIIAKHKGYHRIVEAFERETGASLGGIDRTGTFGLFNTPCIGLSDQTPAVLINFYPFTHLNVIKVKEIIARLKSGVQLKDFYDVPELNIRFTPSNNRAIFFNNYVQGTSVKKLVQLQPDDILLHLESAQLTGRGGAFYPTAKKWNACRAYQSDIKYIICNADEGEPGTFKDRVLMQKFPGLLLEGMIIAGFTVGAQYGIIYLRGEYWWLHDVLHNAIKAFKDAGLLGKNIQGINGFDFDIRIQMGAGAYVCGEETALLESMEGKRGEPRTKWFFPVEKGYLQKPTVVNNVETFCAAARIIEIGTENYNRVGLPGSPGTKLISVSGDCSFPGVYEIPWGITVAEVLDLCGANDPNYIQISGPSGECITLSEKYRRISMLDLLGVQDIRCGGSFMIFNHDREIIDILLNFSEFFKQESCGICTPCRAGNFIIQRKLEKLKNKLGQPDDIVELKSWALLMKSSNRCGLGKTACNSVIMAIDKFNPYFQTLMDKSYDGLNEKFDLDKAIADYEQYKPNG